MRLLSRLRSRFSPACLLIGLAIGGAPLCFGQPIPQSTDKPISAPTFFRTNQMIRNVGMTTNPALNAVSIALPLRFEFSYPTSAISTNLIFRLHGSANAAAPLESWPVDVEIPALNWYSGANFVAPVEGTNYLLKFTNSYAVSQRFLFISTSNLWGISSDFSNVLALDPPPAKTENLKAAVAR